MNTDFINALSILESERGIKKDVLLEAIESALLSAYRRNFGATQNARVDINTEDGEIKVVASKTVVEEVENESSEISLGDARKINEAYEPGDIVEEEITPETFGRIAAQTAKQVVVQKIREAERGVIFDTFIEKEGEVLNAVIHRVERNNVYVELGKAEAIMHASECIPSERYKVNDRIKVYVLEVKKTVRGPQILVSRTHPGLVKRLFELEVPEIMQNLVHIKSIAREAGYRSKIAVYSDDRRIDPVGSCVGQKGSRIERIVAELSGEKIDVIPWSDDVIEFIANALRPAKVIMVQINEKEMAAKVVVPDYQLSLAIGKEGQNARLAAKLTGWKIDIKSQSQIEENMFDDTEEEEEEAAEEALLDDTLDESADGEDAEVPAEEALEEKPEETAAEHSKEAPEENLGETDEEKNDSEDIKIEDIELEDPSLDDLNI